MILKLLELPEVQAALLLSEEGREDEAFEGIQQVIRKLLHEKEVSRCLIWSRTLGNPIESH